MNRIVLISCFFLLLHSLYASDVQQQFQMANEAYSAKQYDQAIEAYEAIAQEAFKSDELFYNLGNCYYHKKQIGKAILNYERALLIAPNDEDTRYNLALTRELLKDDISIIPPFFLARWWGGLRKQLSSTSWSIAGILLLWLGIVGIIIWLKGNTRQLKKKGFVIGLGLILLSLLPFLLAMSQAKLEQNSQRAIILSPEIPLRSAPDELSTELIVLHEGTKLELLDLIGTWHKVRLENGEQGWLPNDAFEQI